MYFRQFFDADHAAMSYLLADLSSGQAVAIDPNPHPYQALVVKSLLAERNLELGLVLLTHTHDSTSNGLADQFPGATLVAGFSTPSTFPIRQVENHEVL